MAPDRTERITSNKISRKMLSPYEKEIQALLRQGGKRQECSIFLPRPGTTLPVLMSLAPILPGTKAAMVVLQVIRASFAISRV